MIKLLGLCSSSEFYFLFVFAPTIYPLSYVLIFWSQELQSSGRGAVEEHHLVQAFFNIIYAGVVISDNMEPFNPFI